MELIYFKLQLRVGNLHDKGKMGMNRQLHEGLEVQNRFPLSGPGHGIMGKKNAASQK